MRRLRYRLALQTKRTDESSALDARDKSPFATAKAVLCFTVQAVFAQAVSTNVGADL